MLLFYLCLSVFICDSTAKTEFFRELVEFTREQVAQKLGF